MNPESKPFNSLSKRGFWQVTLDSLAHTKALATAFTKLLIGGEVVGLSGPLGAGKTEFVRWAAASMGMKGLVNSPTFVLEHIYDLQNSRLKYVHHWDLYRVGSSLEQSEIVELRNDRERVTFIEWPERAEWLESLLFCQISLEFASNLSQLEAANEESANKRIVSIYGLSNEQVALLEKSYAAENV